MDSAEAVFLESLCRNPDDDTARLVYADWLDEAGDLRGEWLRLEVELSRCPAGDEREPKLRQRLSALADGVVDPEWLAQVVRTPVSVCAPSVRFEYHCHQRWHELAETDQANVRFCPECQNVVFLCRTADEAFFRAEHGRCVALEPGLKDETRDRQLKDHFGVQTTMVLGSPELPPKGASLPAGVREGFLRDEQAAEEWLQLQTVARRRQRQNRHSTD